jgi:hypothetical protein
MRPRCSGGSGCAALLHTEAHLAWLGECRRLEADDRDGPVAALG